MVDRLGGSFRESGPAGRIGRASANLRYLPDKTPGLTLWLSADDITGNDGDLVASWVSKDGNAYNFAQSDNAKKPALKKALNGIGGHNVVRFAGDDLLVLPSAPLTGQTGTVFAVFRLTLPATNFQNLFTSADEATTNYAMRIMPFYSAAQPKIAISQRENGDTADEIAASSTILESVPYTAMWQSNGSAYSYRVDGVDQTTTVISGANNGDWFGDVSNRDNTVLGALKRTTEGAFFKGDLAELLVYNSALGAADIAKIETYLNEKYSWVSAQYFGAVGDGTTNDTAAFQAAIDRLTGTNKTIYAPTANYKLGSSLIWKSGVNLRGDGIGQTVFTLADTAQIVATGSVATPIADCAFADFEIDGSAHTGWYKAFFIQYCLRHHYTRVKAKNTGATGFGSDFMVDCSYTDCIADGCGQAGTVDTPGTSGFGIGTGKWQIENVTLTNCTAINNKRYGVFFEAQGSGGAGWYTSQGVRIIGGIYEGNQWGIGDCGVDGMLIDGVTVRNNVAEGIYVGGPGLPASYPGINGTIQNCEIYGNGAAGIRPETGGVGYTLTNNNVHDNGA